MQHNTAWLMQSWHLYLFTVCLSPFAFSMMQVVPLELGPVSAKRPDAALAWVLRQPALPIDLDWTVEVVMNK